MPDEDLPRQPSADEMAALTNIFSNIFLRSLSAALDPGQVSEPNILNPALCELCKSITLDKLIAGFTLHENYGQLMSSAFTCPLCRILLSPLVNQPSDNWWGDEEAQFADEVSAKFVRDAIQLNKFPERLEITVFRPRKEIDKILSENKYAKNPEIRLVKHCIVCTDPKHPLASELRIRPVREKADCEENMQLIKSWIKECEESHEGCALQLHDDNLPELPDRVIDVGLSDGSLEPKLWQTNSDRGRWVALSYCWGKVPFLKLLNEQIKDFELGIPVASMPRTFQDVIKLTRRLGLRYLWIDALCIIQDSEEDWREQSSQMPNIYAGAYITIASSANSTPFDGLFDERNYDFTHNPPVKFDLGQRKGVLEFTMRRDYHSAAGHSNHDPLVKDHLVDRGWCLQEKVLSRRFLAFHPTEIQYTCAKNILLESYYEQDHIWQLKQRGPFGANVRRFEDGDGAWKNDFFSIVQNATKTGLVRNKNKDLVMKHRAQETAEGVRKEYMNITNNLTYLQKLHERWYVILHDYTCRNLTYEKDKLVAISGVVKYILAKSGIEDEYHAGLFRSMLPYALMWKIPAQKRGSEPWMNSRPKDYIAPSWSWASMNDYLDFERCWNYLYEEPTCEILSMTSVPVGKDALSDVKDGRVVMKGRWKKGIIQTHNDNLCHPAPEEMGIERGVALGLGTVHLDDKPTGEREIVCLELWKCQGLLLVEKAGEEGIWERVGIYSMNEWYRPREEDPLDVFTIV